jgi:hypothetical protein
MKNLYLIEFYTNSATGVSGWEINFAWVREESKAAAKAKLQLNLGRRFDCVITNEEHAEIFPLAGDFRVNTTDANLFILA